MSTDLDEDKMAITLSCGWAVPCNYRELFCVYGSRYIISSIQAEVNRAAACHAGQSIADKSSTINIYS